MQYERWKNSLLQCRVSINPITAFISDAKNSMSLILLMELLSISINLKCIVWEDIFSCVYLRRSLHLRSIFCVTIKYYYTVCRKISYILNISINNVLKSCSNGPKPSTTYKETFAIFEGVSGNFLYNALLKKGFFCNIP